MSDSSPSSTVSDTEQTEASPEPDRSPVRSEERLSEAAEALPSEAEADVFADVPNVDANRASASFTVWSTAVAAALKLQGFTDHELAGLGVTGALSVAYQVQDLTPRSFVEGVIAAKALAAEADDPAEHRSPAEAEEAEATEAARSAAEDGATPAEQAEAAAKVHEDAADPAPAEDEAPAPRRASRSRKAAK